MLQSGSLCVVPQAVIFDDIKTGNSECKDIYIHNIGKKPLRVRFTMPINTCFALIGNTSVMTIPGLEIKYSVRYFATTGKSNSCVLKIQSVDGSIDLPISASIAKPQVKFDVENLNMGITEPNLNIKKPLNIVNNGNKECSISLSTNSEKLQVEPKSIKLQPNEEQELQLTFSESIPGNYDFVVNAKMKEEKINITPVKVVVKVVDHELVMIYEDKEINELNFGHIYFGQRRVMQVTIKNKTASTRSFILLPPHDPSSPNFASRAPSTTDDPDIVFTAVPCEGVLKPFSSSVVSFIFGPPSLTEIGESDQMFNHLSTLKIVETKQTVDFQLTGIAISPDFTISAVDFNFGRQIVRTKKSKPLVIENRSQFLPITFNVKEIAQFRITPHTGTIKPNESKEIQITFFPHNLGDFEISTVVDISKGLAKRKLNLTGVSVAKDLENKKFKRVPIYETDKTANFNVHHPSNEYGMSIDEIRRKKEKRDEFDSYLTSSARRREEVQKKKDAIRKATKEAEAYSKQSGRPLNDIDFKDYIMTQLRQNLPDTAEDPVNLGLEHCAGMKPPDPPLLKGGNNFVVADPSKMGLLSTKIGQIPPVKKDNFNDRIMIPNKYKSRPTTSPEQDECSRELDPVKLMQISASHQTINFGYVSVYSTEKRSFEITNSLNNHILVTLKVEDEELSKSSPLSQVIPPQQTGGFDITLYSSKPQNFLKQIIYTINNIHEFAVNIAAQIVTIDVHLSKSEIDFKFPENAVETSVTEPLTLYNKSNSVVHFNWTRFNSVFSVNYESGTIEPNCSLKCEIKYHPGNEPRNELTAILNVVGGSQRSLKLIGDMGKPKLVLEKKHISFGIVQIEKQKDIFTKLKNTSSDPAIFTIINPNEDVLSVTPTIGRIKPGQSQLLQVSVLFNAPIDFQSKVSIVICGAPPITLLVTATAEIPNVEISFPDLNFGQLFIGSSSSRPLSITNHSQIPAVLLLDLSQHPNFHLEFPSHLGIHEPADTGNSVMLVSSSDLSSGNNSQTTTELSRCSSSSESSAIDYTHSFTYKVTVIPNNTLEVHLVFQPRTVGKFSFELPASLLFVPESSKKSAIKSPPSMIKAESVHAPILPSESVIDFGISPTFNKDNPNSNFTTRQLILKNESNIPVNFHFDTEYGETSKSFTVKPMRGRIDYSSTMNIMITFQPHKASPYNQYLPLYVNGEKGESLITKIQLIGVGSSRKFKTSTDSVCFIPVPLGVKVERTIDIINSSYNITFLRATAAVSEKAFPISFHFPKGNRFTYTVPKLPLTISFQSNTPVNFTTTAAILDSEGNSYSFNISAAADNSIFTLYPFLSFGNYNVHNQGNGGPIIASLNDQNIENDFLSNILSASDIIDVEHTKSHTTPLMTNFLVNYLNTLVFTSTKITNIPGDFSNDGGNLIAEMISNLSERKFTIQNFQVLSSFPGAPKSSSNSNLSTISETPASLKMKQMIHYLMSQGAFLSNIRPEFLLTKNEFLDVVRIQITKKLLGIDYYGAPQISSFNSELMDEYTSSQSFNSALLPRLKIAEHLFPSISLESWTIVILQVIKLYMFNKITIDSFLSTSGIQDALKKLKERVRSDAYAEINRSTKSLLTSNIFSPTESMLLKWASVFYCFMNPNDIKVFHDFKDLRDPRVFLALLQAHLSESNSIDFIKNPNNSKDVEKNMSKIIDFMNQVQINFCPSTNEIIEGNDCMVALIIALLYETLPHFIPSLSLDFTIPLCTRKVQVVSITNPSRYEITYNAAIQGSSNFSLIRKSIKIAANETAGFEVQYTARKHMQERATLILTPNKPKMNELQDIKNQPKTTRNATSKLGKPSKSSFTNSIKRPNSARSTSNADASSFASTIVVNLTASTTIKGAFKSVEIEGPLYQPSKKTITIENAPKIAGKFTLYSRYFQVSDENGNLIGENISISKQIGSFLDDPLAEPSYLTATSKFTQTVQQHQAFLFSTKVIEFKDDASPSKIEFEFVPISLGRYRCLVLFYNDQLGEFVYEIIGVANLPLETDTSIKCKIESDQSKVLNINFDVVNRALFFAMSYSICKQTALNSYISDAKFKDLLNFHIREIQSNFLKLFVSIEYKVSCSSQYFTAPTPFLVNTHHAALPLTFSPKNPGDYHCKVVLISDYDVRVFVLNGQALMATKNLLIEMNTVCGRMITQNLPIMNPSDSQWHFKTYLRGDEGYSVIGRFDVAPHATYQLPLTFISKDKGLYNTLLTVTNYTKESAIKYNISALVEDAPAEDKIVLKGRAKEKLHHSFQVNPFIENGTVNVSSTIPILTFNDKLEFAENLPPPKFEFDAYAVRNGFAAGIVTFHDPTSYRSIFYIVEISFESPLPEETIEVKTTSRQSVTIKIPVYNPSKTESVVFDVLFTEEDFFGDKTVEIRPNETKIYELIFSPLRSLERTSYISFINDEQGEFVYQLHLNSEPPGVSILAPLTTPIGKFASASISIENPLDKKVLFKVDNENPNNFQIISNPIITFGPKEKKSIEIRYLPSSIGAVETSIISFISREAGEWYYKVSGTGKPPQPLSPIILECQQYESASTSIGFSNPFPFLAKFEASISTETPGAFSFLSKKNVFTLQNFGDEYSIAISFIPKTEIQFKANVIVRAISLENDITWTFPLIGTTITEKMKPPELKGEANTTIENKFELPLIAENEKCKFDEYKLHVGYPSGYDWLSKILVVRPLEVTHKNNSPCLIVLGTIKPKRPIEKTVTLDVTNPLNQTWHFSINLNVRRGKVVSIIVMESNLKVAATKRISIDQTFQVKTSFRAYFAMGSSTEFSVSPSTGFIEPSLEETRELPFDIIFCPQVYGKLLRGLLVVDMLEQQILFEVVGKVPDYVPPVIKVGKVDTTMPASAKRFAETRSEMKKRNIIKENIENVRNARTGLRVKQVPRKDQY